jgi:hypothetical protein
MSQATIDIESTLAAAERHARQHPYQDGLAELGTGILFVLIGLLFTAEAAAPKGSFLDHSSAILLPVLVIGGYYIVARAIRALKARLSYPRTGYVAYPARDKQRSRWIGAVVAGILGAIIAALFVRAPASLDWIPAFDGIAVGAFLLFLGLRVAVPRFHALAVGSVLIGLAAALARAGESAGTAWYFGGMGLLLVAVGAWVLGGYLRAMPAPAQES